MSEARSYLVTKAFDPEQFPEYLANFSTLQHKDEERLVDRPGKLVVQRKLLPDEVEQVENRPHIILVEPNFTAEVPEPHVGPLESRAVTAQEARRLHGVDAVLGRGIKGKGARVAVIDTGIHERMAVKLGPLLVSKESFVDSEDYEDRESGHGTWCISAIHGIAPEAEIVSLKGLSTFDGSGSYSGIIKAVERARALRCTHISMSLGGPVSVTLNSAVNSADAAGLLVAVAAGNEQRGRTDFVADNTSPASASGAITCAAAGSDMSIGAFSNWGKCVDASAIGVSVQCPDHDLPNLSGFWSGTSMATPHVAGIAALITSAGAAKDMARKAMLSMAVDTTARVEQEGFGFLDAEMAVDEVKPPEPPYYEGLRRMRKKDVSGTPIEQLGGEWIMTYNGVDHGHYKAK